MSQVVLHLINASSKEPLKMFLREELSL